MVEHTLELFKKKALIVGFGGIGRCISERLTGFGMVIDVIAEELPALTNEVNSFLNMLMDANKKPPKFIRGTAALDC